MNAWEFKIGFRVFNDIADPAPTRYSEEETKARYVLFDHGFVDPSTVVAVVEENLENDYSNWPRDCATDQYGMTVSETEKIKTCLQSANKVNNGKK